MFWHGRSFGIILSTAIKIAIYKNMIFAVPQYTLNWFAMFSGVTGMADIVKAAYLVVLTSDTYGIYILFENDISKAKYGASDAQFSSEFPETNGKVMPFRLSRYYGHCRMQIRRFRLELFQWILYAVWSGIVTGLIYILFLNENGGIIGSNGHNFGLESMAIY